jgi:hypothetical protein
VQHLEKPAVAELKGVFRSTTGSDAQRTVTWISNELNVQWDAGLMHQFAAQPLVEDVRNGMKLSPVLNTSDSLTSIALAVAAAATSALNKAPSKRPSW